MRRRKVSVAGLIILSAVTLVAGAATGGAVNTNPSSFYGDLGMDEVTEDNITFWVDTSGVDTCVRVRRTTPTGPDQRIAEHLYGCRDDGSEVDPIAWTGSMYGEYDTEYSRWEEHRRGDEWLFDGESAVEHPGPPVRVDLRWQGHGEARPGFVIGLFLLPWVRTTATRDAVVSGGITIPSQGFTMLVPEQHRGWIRIHTL